MVHLQRLHEEHAVDGLFVYAIAVHDRPDEARRLTAEMRLTYPIFEGTGSPLARRYAYG